MARYDILNRKDFTFPWCRQILDSLDYTPVPFPAFDPPPPTHDPRTRGLNSAVLAHPRRIRAFLAFQHALTDEYVVLVSLGDQVNGHPSFAHGGLRSLLIDELTSVPIRAEDIMTGEIRVAFKRPLPAPGLLLGRAAVSRREGRKWWVKATLEDGEGGVYAEGYALYIQLKSRI